MRRTAYDWLRQRGDRENIYNLNVDDKTYEIDRRKDFDIGNPATLVIADCRFKINKDCYAIDLFVQYQVTNVPKYFENRMESRQAYANDLNFYIAAKLRNKYKNKNKNWMVKNYREVAADIEDIVSRESERFGIDVHCVYFHKNKPVKDLNMLIKSLDSIKAKIKGET